MSHILIAGGSLGGMMAANVLARDGHRVTVLEKAVGDMDGRGAGIVIQPALVEGLRRCGLPQDAVLGVEVEKRVTLDATGQIIGERQLRQTLTSWSFLYQMLRELLPQSSYLQGVQVRSVDDDASQVRVETSTGVLEGDLLVASDGIRSSVRAQFWPDIVPHYAGYVAWRGVCDEALLSRHTLETGDGGFGFCLPPGEQLIGYPVAGPEYRTAVGQRRYNFVWYRPARAPEGLDALFTDADGVLYPLGIPPHKVSWRHIASMRADARALLAPQFAEMIEKTAQPFLQPIYDVVSASIVNGRIALMGDASFVARPHVGAGVTKAMQDALALTEAIGALGATPAALSRYQAERLLVGQQVVARARRLGSYMQSFSLHGQAVQARDAATIMNETAVDLDRVAPEPAPAQPTVA